MDSLEELQYLTDYFESESNFIEEIFEDTKLHSLLEVGITKIFVIWKRLSKKLICKFNFTKLYDKINIANLKPQRINNELYDKIREVLTDINKEEENY